MTWGGRRVAALRAAVVAQWGDRCHLCGGGIPLELRYPHPLSLSLDHVTPRAHGGSDRVENLRPAHLRCNVRRGTKTTTTTGVTTAAPSRAGRARESGRPFFSGGG